MRYPIPDNVSTHSLYDAEQVRTLDARVIASGIPGATLMYRAGAAAFARLRQRWPVVRNIAVLCGSGNNAGDGYVVATLARSYGYRVQVFATRAPDQLTGDAEEFATRFMAAGGAVQVLEPGELPASDAQLWVDALLGTGTRSRLKDWHCQLVNALNASGRPILALDVPSGLDCNSGTPQPVAIRATATVTFVGLKRGLLTAFGPDHCGMLYFDNLGISSHHYVDHPSDVHRIRPPFVWSPRLPSTHKGNTGTCVILGGTTGMTGAAVIAGEAAARTGAGITRIGLLGRPVLDVPVRPELMVSLVEKRNQLEALLDEADVLVVGPGLGRDTWSHQVAEAAWYTDKPLVLDADGLVWLSAQEAGFRRAPVILTPHPGEAARLLGVSTAEIQSRRFEAVRELAARYRATVVLKGVGSLIADAEGQCQLLMAGNPGMASGGMGDLLSGILGALMAQGLSAWEATRFGVWLHATAADQVAEQQGEAGLLALDLLPAVRALMKQE